MFDVYEPKRKHEIVEKVIDFPDEGMLICLTEEEECNLHTVEESDQDLINEYLDRLNKELDRIELVPGEL